MLKAWQFTFLPLEVFGILTLVPEILFAIFWSLASMNSCSLLTVSIIEDCVFVGTLSLSFPIHVSISGRRFSQFTFI